MSADLVGHAERTLVSCLICEMVQKSTSATVELLWLEAEMHPASWTIEEIEMKGWLPLCQMDASEIVKPGNRPYRLRRIDDHVIVVEHYPGPVE